MRRVLISLLALAAMAFGLVGTLGVSEPARRLTAEEPLWFAAIAGPAAQVEPADGATLRWASSARHTLVGPGAPYYDRFLLLSGDVDALPLALGAGVEDAWIARLDPQRPPALVFGALRALHLTGLTRRADDAPAAEVLAADGLDAAHLPSAAAVDALRTAPREFAPAMVNLLAYRDADAYADYGAVAVRTVYGLGGQLQFAGTVREVVRASRRPRDADWESVAVMRYPDPTAILTMEQSPAYRASLEDRDRGLARTEVIVTAVDPGR